MFERPDAKKLKRRFRKRRKQVGELTDQAGRQLDKHILDHIDGFSDSTAWRFVVSWLLLLIVLLGGVAIQARALGRYYLGPHPIAGGEYVEGMEGLFSNASPIFATSGADTSVSKLLFSGLLRYNENGALVGDLAESWSTDSSGTVYTIKLRPNMHWHDGVNITSADVVYTILAIQNPDTRSPYNLSWQGVAVSAPDDQTVVMTLPNPLASFSASLTIGIVPKHRLSNVPYAQLRSDEFNTRLPIGSGPFTWGGVNSLETAGEIEHQRISFSADENYHLGKPKLSRYVIETYPAQSEVVNALKGGQINAAALASLDDVSQSDILKFNQFNVPLMSGVYIFFNNSRAVLSDKTIRNALIRSIDTSELRSQLNYPVIDVTGPILRAHFAYDPAHVQQQTNITEAASLFDKAGWTKAEGTFVRQKDGKALEFSLLTEDQGDYSRVADSLQRQLAEVGVKLTVNVKTGQEFRRALLAHDYDSLLYGITIGSDPDVFPYWHSSQAVADRFNLSEYKSATADTALGSGRSRQDQGLRITKYRTFSDAWRDDVPAVGIYQPRLLFVTNGQLYNFDVKRIASSTERYANVHEWMYLTEDALLSTR
jgi:peptide/nickel transport system substrate-binding protein